MTMAFPLNTDASVSHLEKSYLNRTSSSMLTLKSAARQGFLKARKRRSPAKHAKPKKKSVSFSSFANVTVRQITREELNDSWYSSDEYKDIEEGRKQCIETVKRSLLGHAAPPDPSEFCIHGLEQHLSNNQVMERKLKNSQYRRLLLEEQQIQKLCGVSDPQALQNLSVLFSQQAIRRAQRRAMTGEFIA